MTESDKISLFNDQVEAYCARRRETQYQQMTEVDVIKASHIATAEEVAQGISDVLVSRPGYREIPPGQLVAVLHTGRGQKLQLWELREVSRSPRAGPPSTSGEVLSSIELFALAGTLFLLGCRAIVGLPKTRLPRK